MAYTSHAFVLRSCNPAVEPKDWKFILIRAAATDSIWALLLIWLPVYF